MVKKQPGIAGKKPRAEGPGIEMYFDSRTIRQGETHSKVQGPHAGAGHGAVAAANPLVAAAAVEPSHSPVSTSHAPVAPVIRQLARLQDSLMQPSQEAGDNPVYWSNSPDNQFERAAFQPPVAATALALQKQRLLESRPGQGAAGPSCNDILEEVTAGLIPCLPARARPGPGGAAAGALPNSTSDDQPLRTPGTALRSRGVLKRELVHTLPRGHGTHVRFTPGSSDSGSLKLEGASTVRPQVRKRSRMTATPAGGAGTAATQGKTMAGLLGELLGDALMDMPTFISPTEAMPQAREPSVCAAEAMLPPVIVGPPGKAATLTACVLTSQCTTHMEGKTRMGQSSRSMAAGVREHDAPMAQQPGAHTILGAAATPPGISARQAGRAADAAGPSVCADPFVAVNGVVGEWLCGGKSTPRKAAPTTATAVDPPVLADITCSQEQAVNIVAAPQGVAPVGVAAAEPLLAHAPGPQHGSWRSKDGATALLSPYQAGTAPRLSQRSQQAGGQQAAAADWGDSDDEGLSSLNLEEIEAAACHKAQPAAPMHDHRAGPSASRKDVFFTVVQVWKDQPTDNHACPYETILLLKSPYKGTEVHAHLWQPWNQGDYRAGDPLNLIVSHLDNFDGRLHCRLGDGASPDVPGGLLIHFPDKLMTATRIGTALECVRKSYLDERIKETGPSNKAAVAGTMYHGLFQAAAAGMRGADQLRQRAQEIVASKAEDLLDAGLSQEEALQNLVKAIPHALQFLDRYLRPDPSPATEVHTSGPVPEVEASGECVSRHIAVRDVVDIEEYIAAPRYGIKGQVDLSLRVALHKKQRNQQQRQQYGQRSHHQQYGQQQQQVQQASRVITFGHAGPVKAAGSIPRVAAAKEKEEEEEVVVAFEIKTGKKHDSHGAQVLLYQLLLDDRYAALPRWGLLWYSYEEEPQLVAKRSADVAAIMATRNVAAAALAREELPPLADLRGRCRSCFSRTTCTLAYAAHDGGNAAGWAEAAPGRPNAQLHLAYQADTGHLAPSHLKFLKHWERLLDLESGGRGGQQELWTVPGPDRQATGRCVAGLAVQAVQPPSPGSSASAPWIYTFRAAAGGGALPASPFSVGDRVVLSQEGRHFVVARGNVHAVTSNSIALALGKGMRQGLLHPHAPGSGGATPPNAVDAPAGDPAVLWRLDKEEVASTFPAMRARLYALCAGPSLPNGKENLGAERAAQLRRLIIDLEAPSLPVPAALPHQVVAAVAKEAAALALNAEQVEAVQRAVGGGDYTLVLGMPGAGKTTAIVAMVRALAASGRSVLVTSYTNSAVDNILLKLAQAGDVPFVRLGRGDRVHPGLVDWLPGGRRHGAHTSAELRRLSESVNVVGVSALGVDNVMARRRQFDVCIVDEAGQATLPSLLGPLLLARSFVLVGDHHQLPPLVASAEAEAGGLGVSLFRRLADAHPAAVVALPVQYRMASDIMVLPNLLTYQGQLRCGDAAVAAGALALPPTAAAVLQAAPEWVRAALDPERRVVFLDTALLPPREAAAGESVTNPDEGSLVLQLLQAASAAGVAPGSLGVISPYRPQVALLGRLTKAAGLGGVECLTVDQCQGRDKECVVVSLVRANEERRAGRLLADDRRVNVAITRAKAKLVLVGHGPTLRTLPLFERLLGECERRGWVVAVPAAALHNSAAA